MNNQLLVNKVRESVRGTCAKSLINSSDGQLLILYFQAQAPPVDFNARHSSRLSSFVDSEVAESRPILSSNGCMASLVEPAGPRLLSSMASRSRRFVVRSCR